MATMRGDGMATRRERLAKIKKGPGVFVYEGGACAKEFIPTVKRIGRKEPLLDQNGYPVVDSSGRQIYQPSGQPVRENGIPVLGGIPKVENRPLDFLTIQGVKLNRGVPVFVSDEVVAVKMRCMAFVKEIDKMPETTEEEAPKKRGRPKKTEE